MFAYANYSLKARIIACLLDMLTFPFQYHKRKKPPLKIKKILLVRPDHLGDVLMNMDSMYSLKKENPDCQLHLITPEWNKPIFERLLFINKFFYINLKWYCFNQEKHLNLSHLIRFAWSLRKEKYDVFIDFRGDFRIVFLFGFLTKAKIRVGFSNLGGKHFLNESIPFDSRLHYWEQNFRLVEKFVSARSRFQLELKNPEIQKGEEICQKHDLRKKPFVMIHPTVAHYWKVKRWGEDNFAKIAIYLMSRYNLKIVICSGPREKETGDRIAKMLPHAINLSGALELFEFAALLKKTRFLISNDSAPMHLAFYLGVPLIAIFGPTNYRRSGPFPLNERQIALEGKTGLKRPLFGASAIKPAYFPKIADVITAIDGLMKILGE